MCYSTFWRFACGHRSRSAGLAPCGEIFGQSTMCDIQNLEARRLELCRACQTGNVILEGHMSNSTTDGSQYNTKSQAPRHSYTPNVGSEHHEEAPDEPHWGNIEVAINRTTVAIQAIRDEARALSKHYHAPLQRLGSATLRSPRNSYRARRPSTPHPFGLPGIVPRYHVVATETRSNTPSASRSSFPPSGDLPRTKTSQASAPIRPPINIESMRNFLNDLAGAEMHESRPPITSGPLKSISRRRHVQEQPIYTPTTTSAEQISTLLPTNLTPRPNTHTAARVHSPGCRCPHCRQDPPVQSSIHVVADRTAITAEPTLASRAVRSSPWLRQHRTSYSNGRRIHTYPPSPSAMSQSNYNSQASFILASPETVRRTMEELDGHRRQDVFRRSSGRVGDSVTGTAAETTDKKTEKDWSMRER